MIVGTFKVISPSVFDSVADVDGNSSFDIIIFNFDCVPRKRKQLSIKADVDLSLLEAANIQVVIIDIFFD